MKKCVSLISLALAFAMSTGAFAMEVPTDTVVQNLNGSQQVIKTFTVAPDEDPQTLIEEPFELEGYLYTFKDITKVENLIDDTKRYTEVVTVETTDDDLSVILEKLMPTIEYDDGQYHGTLTLDHTSLYTEATSYSTRSYTVSETKTIGQLDRNDMSYVPATTVKNGVTLSLADVDWQVTGTDLVGEVLAPSSYPIPTISFFAASNEIPNFNDPQEKILAALYDRLELKVVTQNIAGRENRLRMLKAKQSGSSGQIQCTITLDELLEMQREVAAIPVPDAANELADDILCELRKNGMTVSDRKYLGYYPIAQAKAWLSGHTHVESTDLLALKNYLWHLPADRVMVESTLQRMCVNPMLDKVNDVRSMAMEARDEYDAARSDTNKAGAANRALVKLRGELLRLFEMQKKLEAEARTDSERVLTAELLQDMEQISRQAHEAVGFTYIPLEQLAALQ